MKGTESLGDGGGSGSLRVEGTCSSLSERTKGESSLEGTGTGAIFRRVLFLTLKGTEGLGLVAMCLRLIQNYIIVLF